MSSNQFGLYREDDNLIKTELISSKANRQDMNEINSKDVEKQKGRKVIVTSAEVN